MEKKKLSKAITLVIPDNLFNQSMLILEKYFDYETLDPSTFEVKSVRSIRKVGYTTEQEKAIVKDYKLFLQLSAVGKKITWYHVRKGKEYGISKTQVLSILKKHGILNPELHRKNRNYEK